MCGKMVLMFLGVACLALMKSHTQAAPLSINLDSEALMSALRQVAPRMVPARQYGEDDEDSMDEERQQHDPNHEYRRQMAGWQKLAAALQSAPAQAQVARQEDNFDQEEAQQRARRVHAVDGPAMDQQKAPGMSLQDQERLAHQMREEKAPAQGARQVRGVDGPFVQGQVYRYGNQKAPGMAPQDQERLAHQMRENRAPAHAAHQDYDDDNDDNDNDEGGRYDD